MPKLSYAAKMHIIDRYILRQFVQTFVICFLSLLGLYIVVEVFTNLDQFVRCGQKAGGVLPFIAHYYSYQSISFFDRTGGILAMVSAMFTVSWIQRHNEMTALLAAGVPRIRVLMPIILAVVAISLLSAANREIFIPRFRSELSKRPQDPLGDMPQSLERRSDNQTDVVLGGKNTYALNMRIEEPVFLMPPALQKYGKQLLADNAYYQPPKGDRPGGYLLDGVREPKNLDTRPSLMLNQQPVLITPRDAPDWLKPNQCFLRSDVDFDQLTGGHTFKQLASISQLMAGLRNPSLDFGLDVRVTIHSRIVQPLLDITLLFLGLPLVVSRENRNVFIAMGLCMALTAAFIVVGYVTQQMGVMSFWIFNPSLAAWAPLMIFVPPAVGLSGSLWK